MYLVDTNVLSAGAPRKAAELAAVADWMDDHSSAIYISVITFAELEAGIAKARHTGATRKAANLQGWLSSILHLYSDRILPVDLPIARVVGNLSERVRAAGHAPGLADIIMAATAQHHELSVLTRNRKHFDPLGVDAYDPFVALPP